MISLIDQFQNTYFEIYIYIYIERERERGIQILNNQICTFFIKKIVEYLLQVKKIITINLNSDILNTGICFGENKWNQDVHLEEKNQNKDFYHIYNLFPSNPKILVSIFPLAKQFAFPLPSMKNQFNKLQLKGLPAIYTMKITMNKKVERNIFIYL